MHVYMVLTLLAPIGGIESSLLPIALELKTRGHEVTVYLIETVRYPNQNAEALNRANIAVVSAPPWLVALARLGIKLHLPILQTILVIASPVLAPLVVADAVYRRRGLGRSFQGAVGRLRGWLAARLVFENIYYWKLASLFQKSPPDVIHVHGWGCGEDPPGALDWLARFHYPVVYTEHNSPDPAIMSEFPNAPMNLAHVIIAVSQAAATGLVKVGHASRPVKIIPYSVEALPDTSGHHSVHGFVVACIARLATQKGHRYLLQAFQTVVRQVPTARLWLAGEGPLRAELEATCKELGLGDHVQFLGRVNRADLPKLYSQLNAIVLASLWEGLPVTLIEAMSAGLPIVATAVGGNAELVRTGENGWIVPPHDPAALANALIQLANNNERRLQMGRCSRRYFEEGGFSRAEVTASTLDAYQLAIQSAQAN